MGNENVLSISTLDDFEWGGKTNRKKGWKREEKIVALEAYKYERRSIEPRFPLPSIM